MVSERKTALTFEEKITVAFMHYVRQIDQQDLAMLYGVNGGRVNEACLTIKHALAPSAPSALSALFPHVKAVDND